MHLERLVDCTIITSIERENTSGSARTRLVVGNNIMMVKMSDKERKKNMVKVNNKVN